MPTKRHPDPAIAAAVLAHARAGHTRAQVAAALDIGERTITRWYGDQLKSGRLRAVATISETLYAKAAAGDTICMLFYLKTQGQWRETNRTELTAADGAPLQPTSLILVPAADADTWREEVSKRQAALLDRVQAFAKAQS